MAWSTPANVSTGDFMTAADWNELVDDINYLNARPSDEYTLNEGSDYTTTSSSFVAIDSTNLSLSITSNGGDILIGFTGHANHSTSSEFIHFDIFVDIGGGGYNAIAGDDGIQVMKAPVANAVIPTNIIHLYTGAVSGSVYTFRLYWKTSASTATLYAGAGTVPVDVHPQFWIKEI